MKRLLIISLLLAAFYSNAQQSLTLPDCYALANKNYPLAKQIGLLQQKSDYEVDALQTGKPYRNRHCPKCRAINERIG